MDNLDNPFFNLAPRIRVLLVKRRTAKDFGDVKTWMEVHDKGQHPHVFVSLETKDSALLEGVHEVTVAPNFQNQVLRFSLESLPEHCPPTLHMQHVFAQSLLFWMGLHEHHHVIIVCDLCLHTVLILEFLLRALHLDQEETPFQLIQKAFPSFPVTREQRDQKSCQVYDAHVDTIFSNAPHRYQSQIVYLKSITLNHLNGHLLQDLEIRIFQLGFKKRHIKKYPVVDRRAYTVRSPDQSTLEFVFFNRTASPVDQTKTRLMCGDTWFELRKKSGGVLARWPVHTCFLGAQSEVIRWTLPDVDCPDEAASAELGAHLEIEVMLGFFKRDDEKNRKFCQSEQIKYCSRVLSKPESSVDCFLSSHMVEPTKDMLSVLRRENGCKEKDACVSLILANNNALLAHEILNRLFSTNRHHSADWRGTTGRHLNPAQLRCVSGYTEESLIPPPSRPVNPLNSTMLVTPMKGVQQPPDELVATDESTLRRLRQKKIQQPILLRKWSDLHPTGARRDNPVPQNMDQDSPPYFIPSPSFDPGVKTPGTPYRGPQSSDAGGSASPMQGLSTARKKRTSGSETGSICVCSKLNPNVMDTLLKNLDRLDQLKVDQMENLLKTPLIQGHSSATPLANTPGPAALPALPAPPPVVKPPLKPPVKPPILTPPPPVPVKPEEAPKTDSPPTPEVSPPPVAPPAKGKGKGKGKGPAPPPLLKAVPKAIKPTLPFGKKFHWVPILKELPPLWESPTSAEKKLSNPQLSFEYVRQVFEMDEATKLKLAKAKEIYEKRQAASTSKFQILSTKRAQNIAIVLCRINYDLGALVHQLDTLNPCGSQGSHPATEELQEKFSDLLFKTLEILPTPEEHQEFAEYSGSLDDLREVEARLMPLVSCHNPVMKIKILQFGTKLQSNLCYFLNGLDLVSEACHVLTSSAALHRILRLVLEIGNYVNYGVPDAVSGFNLETLKKLSEFKAASSPACSLWHFLAHCLAKKDPESLNIPQELGVPRLAVKLSFPNLLQEIEGWLAENKRIITEFDMNSTSYSDEAQTYLAATYRDATLLASILKNRVQQVEELVQHTFKYFGEDPKKRSVDEFFVLLIQFADRLLECHRELMNPSYKERFKGLLEAEFS